MAVEQAGRQDILLAAAEQRGMAAAGSRAPQRARPEPSDEQLLRQLAAGQQEALVALHARYAPLILNLAGRALGRLAAEEIVQDVFLAVW